MSREVLSKFGIPDSENPLKKLASTRHSEDPLKKLASIRPDLSARIKVMAEDTAQQAKILATQPASEQETPINPQSASKLRAKPYDPNDPKTKLGQRVLPPEPG